QSAPTATRRWGRTVVIILDGIQCSPAPLISERLSSVGLSVVMLMSPLTEISGGGPGLQAGEESGPSPFAYRSSKGVVKCEHAYGVQGAGLPHRAASGGAEPHVRLRTPGVEQGPRVAARPLPRRRDQNVVRGDRPVPDRTQAGPRVRVPVRGVLGPAPADTAPPVHGVRELLRRARTLSPVQVPPWAPVCHLHPQRVSLARWPVVAGEDGRPAGVRVGLARRGPDHTQPDHGDHLPRPGWSLVRLHRLWLRRPRDPPRGRCCGRSRPRDAGLRGPVHRREDPYPAPPGTQGPDPGVLPAAHGPQTTRVELPGQSPGEGRR